MTKIDSIGWGLVDASCSDKPMLVQRLLLVVPGYVQHVPSCDLYRLLGALAGAVLCAVGAAIMRATPNVINSVP